MNIEKELEKYIKQFGDKLIDDVAQTIKDNNWVRSGNLLNSLEVNVRLLKDEIVTELYIADYFQYLKAGKSKTTNRIKTPNTLISNRALKQGVNIPDNKITFVSPLIKKNIELFEKTMVKKIEDDLVNKLTQEIEKAIKK